MPRRKNKFVEQADELNLVPIMNLVLCLIPVVLFGTQLVKIGITNISAPKLGPPPQNQTPPEVKPLGLTIAIASDGFRLKATGVDNLAAHLAEANCLSGGGTAAPANASGGVLIPKVQQNRLVRDQNTGTDSEQTIQGYDYPRLYLCLEYLRGRHPEEKLLSLTAEPDMPFKYLIRTMDTVRYKLADPVRNQNGARGAHLLGVQGGTQSLENFAKAVEFSIEKQVTTATGDDGTEQQVEQLIELWSQVTFTVVR